jgi:hypothetical protein
VIGLIGEFEYREEDFSRDPTLLAETGADSRRLVGGLQERHSLPVEVAAPLALKE